MNVKGFIFRLIFVLCFVVALPSCASKEDLEQLEQRVDELGKELDQLSLLVQQIDRGGYVVAVIPDEDGNGYTLAFNDGRTVHISLSVKSGSASAQGAGSGITFKSVDTSNPDCVVITLSDGTVLRLPTWAAFDALQQQVKQLNINLSALSRIVSALKDNDYLLSMSPFVEDGVPVGWLLNFSKSGLVVIYSSGASATPQIGVRQDSDGVYYWTLNGDWLLDSEGRKVRAQGANGADAVAPRIKIDEGYWWISYDDGASWSQLGKATGEDGDSIFREVDQSNEEFVRLVLADGDTILIPRYVPLDIILYLPSDMVLNNGEELEIPFKIIGTHHEDVSVSVLVNGALLADVFRYYDYLEEGPVLADYGFITVHGRSNTDYGTVVVMLSTATGSAVVKPLRFEPRGISLYDSDGNPRNLDYFQCGYNFASTGGRISIHYTSNTSFVLDTSDVPWVKVVKGYSGLEGDIVLEAGENDEFFREGCVWLRFQDEDWAGERRFAPTRYNFSISQDSANFSMDKTFVSATNEHKVFELEVNTDMSGLSSRVVDGEGWLSSRIERKSDSCWILSLDVSENTGGSERSGVAEILTGDESLGKVSVNQRNSDVDNDSQKIKFKVLALPENGYRVQLPFTGELNLEVDWGDDVVSFIKRPAGNKERPLVHKYSGLSGPCEFTVGAYGRIQSMNSDEIADLVSIVSIFQWGDVHNYTSMAHAFRNVKTLRSVSRDEYHSLSYVTTFEGAFEGCTNLTDVSEGLFSGAFSARNFKNAFAGVSSVTGESPYVIDANGHKMHLYERDGTTPGPFEGLIYPWVSYYSGCFSGGNWADQEAIHLAGWD